MIVSCPVFLLLYTFIDQYLVLSLVDTCEQHRRVLICDRVEERVVGVEASWLGATDTDCLIYLLPVGHSVTGSLTSILVHLQAHANRNSNTETMVGSGHTSMIAFCSTSFM